MSYKCGRVSVIVPVYKVEKYINVCIESIVKQTYSDLEIILVNDGSPDNCPLICDEWKSKDSRISVIHQKNMGVSAARNSALMQMTGDYVLFVDSDDWIAKNMIEVLVKKMEESKEIDAVFCGYFEIDDDGQKIRTVNPKHTGVVSRNEGIESIFDAYGTVLWNKMFRADLLKEKVLFDLELKIGEDELWMIDVLKNAKKICLYNESLYYYRRRLEGASNDYRLNSRRLSEIVAQQKAILSVSDYNSDLLVNIVESRLYYCGYKILRLAYYQGDYDNFTKIDKEIENGRKIWYASYGSFWGNCRRKLVEKMMRMRISYRIVRIFDKNDMLEWNK